MQTIAQIEQTNNQVPPNPSTQQTGQYNRLSTYNTPAVTVQRPNQSIGYAQNQQIEFNHKPPLTYIQPTVQRKIEHMQTNEVAPLMHIQPTVQRQIEHMQTNEVGYNQPTVQRQIEHMQNKPIEFNQAA